MDPKVWREIDLPILLSRKESDALERSQEGFGETELGRGLAAWAGVCKLRLPKSPCRASDVLDIMGLKVHRFQRSATHV